MTLANIGIPMLIITLPRMVVALPGVVLIEAFVFRRQLAVSFKSAFRASIYANAASTLIGVPLAWASLAGLELLAIDSFPELYRPVWRDAPSIVERAIYLLVQAPWLAGHRSDGYWLKPAACLVLLLPFFWASYATERPIVRRMLREVDPERARAAVLKANVVTYAGLLLITTGWLVQTLLQGPVQ